LYSVRGGAELRWALSYTFEELNGFELGAAPPVQIR
jgi:hypothetical protein